MCGRVSRWGLVASGSGPELAWDHQRVPPPHGVYLLSSLLGPSESRPRRSPRHVPVVSGQAAGQLPRSRAPPPC